MRMPCGIFCRKTWAYQILRSRTSVIVKPQWLRSLTELNDEIRVGDAILIYYAGYGGSAELPELSHWNGGKVELLVPYDHFSLDGDFIILEKLLSDFAFKKGDNIVRQTFIFPEFTTIYQLTT